MNINVHRQPFLGIQCKCQGKWTVKLIKCPLWRSTLITHSMEWKGFYRAQRFFLFQWLLVFRRWGPEAQLCYTEIFPRNLFYFVILNSMYLIAKIWPTDVCIMAFHQVSSLWVSCHGLYLKCYVKATAPDMCLASLLGGR